MFTFFPIVIANLMPLWLMMNGQTDVFSLVVIYWLEGFIIYIFSIWKIKLARNIGNIEMRRGGQKVNEITKPMLIRFVLAVFLLASVFHSLFIIILGWKFFPIPTSEIVFPALVSFFASHLISFLYYYWHRKEYEIKTVASLIFVPIKRIFITNGVIGAALSGVLISDSPWVAILLIVVIKSVMDIVFHFIEHKNSAVEDRLTISI